MRVSPRRTVTDLRSQATAETREFGQRGVPGGEPPAGIGQIVTPTRIVTPADPALPDSPDSAWRGSRHHPIRHDKPAPVLPAVFFLPAASVEANDTNSAADGSVIDVQSQR